MCEEFSKYIIQENLRAQFWPNKKKEEELKKKQIWVNHAENKHFFYIKM